MSKPIDTLPMHLALSLMNWMACDTVLQHASAESANSKPSSKQQKNPKQKRRPQKHQAVNPNDALNLLGQLESQLSALLSNGPQSKAKDPKNNLPDPRARPDRSEVNVENFLAYLSQPNLMDAIREEARMRSVRMLEGLDNYQDIAIEVEETPHDIVWEKGSARLLDYGGAGPLVLCIPSLINRYYILDLYGEHSLIEYLLGQGFHPLVLDWGSPQGVEKSYDMAAYVRHIAAPALRFARDEYGEPVHLMGYCMGGIFALALAVLDPEAVETLSLLATPWDFSLQGAPIAALSGEAVEAYRNQLSEQDVVPPWWVQCLFHLLSPWHFQEKFGRLPYMDVQEQQHFAAVESWVNDGVPLARNVARECLIDWPLKNTLRQGQWRIGRELIIPEDVVCPCFMAIPTEDRIVPPNASEPLAEQMADVTIIRPKTGHVSMVVGHQARRNTWQPWARWLKARS